MWVKQVPAEIALVKKAMLFLQQLRLSAIDNIGTEKNQNTKQLKSSVEALLQEIPLLGETTAFISILQERHRLLQESDVWILLKSFATTKDSKQRRRVFRQYEKMVDKKEVDRLKEDLKIEILILGQKNSGRSTICKQLMRHCKHEFKHKKKYRKQIYNGLVTAMRRMCYHCNRLRRQNHDMSEGELMRQLMIMLSHSERTDRVESLQKHSDNKMAYDLAMTEYHNLLRMAANDFSKLHEAVEVAERLQNMEKSFLPESTLGEWKKEFFSQFAFKEDTKEAQQLVEKEWELMIKRGENVKFSLELGRAINELWSQPNVQLAYELRQNFSISQVGESAAYFFERAVQIAKSNESEGSHHGYVPSEDDIVRCPENKPWKKPIDIKHAVNGKEVEIKLVDMETEDDRGYVKYLAKNTMIFYVVDLSSYEYMDEHGSNQLLSEMSAFGQVCSDPVLSGVPIILFFNKVDIFKNRLKVTPFSVCSPDIDEKSTQSYEKCIEYISGKFKRKAENVGNRPRKIPVHTIVAVDQESARASTEELESFAVKTLLG